MDFSVIYRKNKNNVIFVLNAAEKNIEGWQEKLKEGKNLFQKLTNTLFELKSVKDNYLTCFGAMKDIHEQMTQLMLFEIWECVDKLEGVLEVICKYSELLGKNEEALNVFLLDEPPETFQQTMREEDKQRFSAFLNSSELTKEMKDVLVLAECVAKMKMMVLNDCELKKKIVREVKESVQNLSNANEGEGNNNRVPINFADTKYLIVLWVFTPYVDDLIINSFMENLHAFRRAS
eukprot:TRINITY_DN16593_c0_g1_i2.p1 TRINITY_DN16593_c0_g1~~TRINITY_DN16593_c0_g1_i2.p1  ORF type:complete len:234 (-),score=50.25 TRINITY_DN16593_c0_g1_i2:134-835(-)